MRSECDTMDETRTPWPNNLAEVRANSRGCQHISRLHDLLAGWDVSARPARCAVVFIDLGSRESCLAGWGDQGRNIDTTSSTITTTAPYIAVVVIVLEVDFDDPRRGIGGKYLVTMLGNAWNEW